MLNLSQNNSIEGKIEPIGLESFSLIRHYKINVIITRILMVGLCLFFVLLMLPWTQNIQSKGYVTTLKPDQRPQNIHSVIGGQIERWHVKEGDYVKAGDTILFISEIKDDYFDPELLGKTENQIRSKELAVKSYMEKVNAIDQQINAMFNTKKLKLQQAKNYILQAQLNIQSDSMDLLAEINNYEIAQKQLIRTDQLYKDGLKSLTDLEIKKVKLQESKAKMIGAENKLLESKNKLINSQVEIGSIENQYRDKLSKAESEKYASLSNMYDAEALVSKMQNQYMNYSIRSGYYYVVAPQNGFITKTLKAGIGETIKEGEKLVSIMPEIYDFAVAMFVEPMDIPLIKKGNIVRFMFDGWPTIVFSGWPNLSYGTFPGEVVAIDNFISENGKYRILVAPKESNPWPIELRIGSGANGMALLKEVPIWYELWRNLNGFPPDYYNQTNKGENEK